MQNKTKYVILTLIVILAWYYYRLSQAADKLTFGVGVPQKISGAGGQLSFLLPLKITNADTISIPIFSMSVKNILQGSQIGTTRFEKIYFIKGNATTTLNAIVTVPFKDLIAEIPIILTAISNKKITFGFSGKLNAAFIPLNISESYSIDLNGIL